MTYETYIQSSRLIWWFAHDVLFQFCIISPPFLQVVDVHCRNCHHEAACSPYTFAQSATSLADCTHRFTSKSQRENLIRSKQLHFPLPNFQFFIKQILNSPPTPPKTPAPLPAAHSPLPPSSSTSAPLMHAILTIPLLTLPTLLMLTFPMLTLLTLMLRRTPLPPM